MISSHTIEAVVLDMDGLMLDTEPIYRFAWQRAAADLGYTLNDAFYLSLIGRTNADAEYELMQAFGSRFPFIQFRTLWLEIWITHVKEAGIPVKPGLWELLDLLRARAVPVAVATSSDHHYTAVSLHAAQLEGRFAAIVTGDEVLRGKPAPDIFLEAAKRLNIRPERCLALEDSDAGVLAAAAAGMTVLMVPDLKPPSPEATAAAFCVFASLYEAMEAIVQWLC